MFHKVLISLLVFAFLKFNSINPNIFIRYIFASTEIFIFNLYYKLINRYSVIHYYLHSLELIILKYASKILFQEEVLVIANIGSPPNLLAQNVMAQHVNSFVLIQFFYIIANCLADQ
jgi:hypothetical protein